MFVIYHEIQQNIATHPRCINCTSTRQLNLTMDHDGIYEQPQPAFLLRILLDGEETHISLVVCFTYQSTKSLINKNTNDRLKATLSNYMFYRLMSNLTEKAITWFLCETFTRQMNVMQQRHSNVSLLRFLCFHLFSSKRQFFGV